MPDNDQTRKSVTEHEVHLQYIAESMAALRGDFNALRDDLHRRWPQCSVHDERLDQLENALGQRTTGGVVGFLALVAYAIQDFIRRP